MCMPALSTGRFEREHGVQYTGKVFASTSKLATEEREEDGGKSFCGKRMGINAVDAKESSANPQRGMNPKL